MWTHEHDTDREGELTFSGHQACFENKTNLLLNLIEKNV